MTSVFYTTRESVKAALDVKVSARNDRQVDEVIAAASRAVEGFLHRTFYPWTGTRYFDWPNRQGARSWRLWLDQHDLISVDVLKVAGEEIPSSDYFLRPDDGPPYTHIEIDLDGPAAFASAGTHQRAIEVTGVFGYRGDEADAGTLAAPLDSSSTGVTVSDSEAIGVGDVIRVGSERMLVAGKRMASTGQAVQAPLSSSNADVSVLVEDGTGFAVDEVILIDSERMLVVDVAGNVLTVKRAWDGSVLAGHTGSTVYAPRLLTVERGALGTAATSHSGGTSIARHEPPALIRELTLAESVNTLLQRQAGYARTVGSGDNQREAAGRALRDIRDQAYTTYGRKARIRAV